MMRIRLWTRLTLATALLLAAACGRQDLYELPDTPYPELGRLDLPSANEAVAVMGDFAFVAGGEAGMHVVDISDPADPVLVVTINTTKYAESIEVVRTFRDGRRVDIAHVVEGTEGVTSYDVTDPYHPMSLEQGTTAVDGNRMAIVLPEDPTEPYTVFLAENWKGVRVFTANPNAAGVLDYGGVFSGTLGFAKAAVYRDGWLYVADDEMGLVVMDASLLVLGAFGVASSVDTPGNALDVALEGDYVFVADGTEGIQVFDVGVPDEPVLVGSLDLPAYNRSLVVRDGLAVVAAATGGVHVVDVSDPTNPIYAGNVPTAYASDLALTENGLVLLADYDDGLIIMSGEAFRDRQAPGPAREIEATAYSLQRIDLSFLAGGDDGYLGVAMAYEVRYDDAPIESESDFEAATPFANSVAPAGPLLPDMISVTGLSPDTEYHFAVRVLDEAGHASTLSASVSARTRPEGVLLIDGSLDAIVSTTATECVFEVTCLNSTPALPVVHEVLIDGEAHSMDHVSGDGLSGALYRHEATLPVGEHDYGFRFENDTGDGDETEVYTGPYVGLSVLEMGSPESDLGRDADEAQHHVCFTRAVLAAATEVTQAEWTALMGDNPSEYLGDEMPVQKVSWYRAIEYCNALSDRDDLAPAYTINGSSVSWNREAEGWRLPTEAEWEWLSRAGSPSAFCGGDITVPGFGLDPVLDQYGWYGGNVDPRAPHEVGGKLPNAYGLHDMHGNVAEWCWDWYGEYAAGPLMDAAGPAYGEFKTIRGGDWFYEAKACRSASRETFPPDSVDSRVGFRVVRTLTEE